MKKYKRLLLIFILTFLILPLNIFAANMKVVFTTSFAGNIDLENIDSIFVTINPKDFREDKEIVLKYSKDFKYEEVLNINDVTIADVFVNKDYNGKYDYTYDKVRVSDSEMEVHINIFLAKKEEKKTSAVINESIYGDIFGEDYVDRITEKVTTHAVDDDYVDPGNNGSSSGNGSGEGNGTTSESGSNTTTNSSSTTETTTNEYGQTDKDLEIQSKRIEEERKEAEKQENIKKRNKIYIYILIGLICIIIIAIIVVLIKIAKANK